MTEFVNLDQITAATPNLQPQGDGPLGTTVDQQREDLTAYLTLVNLAHKSGLPTQVLPEVTIDYRTVTKSKRRIAGRDFKKKAGVPVTTHQGRATSVKRSKARNLYFHLLDSTRQAGTEDAWTSIRLDGIRGFDFVHEADRDVVRERVAILRTVAEGQRLIQEGQALIAQAFERQAALGGAA
jgi:hypothetical protein